MSEKEGVHFAEAEGDLPPPHLPFDLPLVPMDPNIFDAKENHPLKDRIRHDGVPYSQVIAAEQEHEEQQVEVPPLLHRKSTVVNLHQLSRKNSIRMEKTHKKVKSKLMAAEPQTVTYQEKKNSAALKFPVDVIQQSQQRLKKAAASSNRQSRRPREAAPSILNSVLDDGEIRLSLLFRIETTCHPFVDLCSISYFCNLFTIELNGADDSGASYRRFDHEYGLLFFLSLYLRFRLFDESTIITRYDR
eukprot:TRINITY_DN529_c0_g1_i1.p2 TRINITY_DN529_c0_g1~~TRINITY_DN529_c0_g1_i1.p2  ORF type:complete len:246 (+),score=45.54 TRINITY_DN529_c0_g1_i1:59-796(+)